MSYASDPSFTERGPWRDPRFMPDNPFRPAMIVMMVIGFIVAWPIGLAILAYMFGRRKMACWNAESGDRWQYKMTRLQEKMDRLRERMDGRGFAGFGGGWGGPPSSGNRAFDEYRAETIRRLEDEQREFKDFLERLRMAKDKAEFDQFMSERRGRPTPPRDTSRDEVQPFTPNA